jgi:hypothetical protein
MSKPPKPKIIFLESHIRHFNVEAEPKPKIIIFLESHIRHFNVEAEPKPKIIFLESRTKSHHTF